MALEKRLRLRFNHCMSKIEIYTTTTCPFCQAAKSLLAQKEVSYFEIDVTNKAQLRQDMTARAGGVTSVPQIFIDNEHIGGCDDLYALDKNGSLNPLLGLESE
jgi:glutaredoxin 3